MKKKRQDVPKTHSFWINLLSMIKLKYFYLSIVVFCLGFMCVIQLFWMLEKTSRKIRSDILKSNGTQNSILKSCPRISPNLSKFFLSLMWCLFVCLVFLFVCFCFVLFRFVCLFDNKTRREMLYLKS